MMAKHWSERLSCQCGKTFRSISAEAVHRHNFPALCRRKPKAAWEVVAGLEWTRTQDGEDNSGRPLYDYHAKHGNVRFEIIKSTDRGFGIVVRDDDAKKYLTHHFGIEWRRTLRNCHERAVEIMNQISGDK
jgi:hypothetical protein